MKTDKLKICIVTAPISKSGLLPLSNIISIFESLSEEIYLISGNEFVPPDIRSKVKHITMIDYNYENKGIIKPIKYAFLQLEIAFSSLKMIKNSCVFVFIFADHLILPMVTLKVLNQKVIIQLSGSISNYNEYQHRIYGKFIILLQRINYLLSNQLLVYSPLLITEWGLGSYKKKISVVRRHFINYKLFKPASTLNQKSNLIGYIGRLSEEKGIWNFVHAIPLLLKLDKKYEFLIAGDGNLCNDVISYLERNKLSKHVTFVGWITHNELPTYLNKLKLTVLPSHTEGLPNILLESMACGTPVLATPVGAVPDIIIDEKTGFIMENNSCECITRNILRALEHPNLEIIAENARTFIENEYNYKNAVYSYRSMINRL